MLPHQLPWKCISESLLELIIQHECSAGSRKPDPAWQGFADSSAVRHHTQINKQKETIVFASQEVSAFFWGATQSLNHTSFSSMEGKHLWLSWFCLTLSSTGHQRGHPRAVAGAERWQSQRTCWWFAAPRAAPCPAQTRSRLPGPAHSHKRGSENSTFQHNTHKQQEENKPVFSLSTIKTEWITELWMHKDCLKND